MGVANCVIRLMGTFFKSDGEAPFDSYEQYFRAPGLNGSRERPGVFESFRKHRHQRNSYTSYFPTQFLFLTFFEYFTDL